MINAKDVKFVRHESKAYIQARFISSPDDNITRYGDGYCDTKLKLFKIDEFKSERGKKEKKGTGFRSI